MLLLRLGRGSRWKNRSATVSTDVDEAAKDLALRQGEDGLSVYKVADEAEAHRIALTWSIEKRDRDDNLDYILFDEGQVSDSHELRFVEDKHAEDAELRTKHHELYELESGAGLALARRLLQNGVEVKRIKKADVAAYRNKLSELVLPTEPAQEGLPPPEDG